MNIDSGRRCLIVKFRHIIFDIGQDGPGSQIKWIAISIRHSCKGSRQVNRQLFAVVAISNWVINLIIQVEGECIIARVIRRAVIVMGQVKYDPATSNTLDHG